MGSALCRNCFPDSPRDSYVVDIDGPTVNQSYKSSCAQPVPQCVCGSVTQLTTPRGVPVHTLHSIMACDEPHYLHSVFTPPVSRSASPSMAYFPCPIDCTTQQYSPRAMLSSRAITGSQCHNQQPVEVTSHSPRNNQGMNDTPSPIRHRSKSPRPLSTRGPQVSFAEPQPITTYHEMYIMHPQRSPTSTIQPNTPPEACYRDESHDTSVSTRLHERVSLSSTPSGEGKPKLASIGNQTPTNSSSKYTAAYARSIALFAAEHEDHNQHESEVLLSNEMPASKPVHRSFSPATSIIPTIVVQAEPHTTKPIITSASTSPRYVPLVRNGTLRNDSDNTVMSSVFVMDDNINRSIPQSQFRLDMDRVTGTRRSGSRLHAQRAGHETPRGALGIPPTYTKMDGDETTGYGIPNTYLQMDKTQTGHRIPYPEKTSQASHYAHSHHSNRCISLPPRLDHQRSC